MKRATYCLDDIFRPKYNGLNETDYITTGASLEQMGIGRLWEIGELENILVKDASGERVRESEEWN